MMILNYSSKTKVQNEFPEKMVEGQKISEWHQKKYVEMTEFPDIGPLMNYISMKAVYFQVSSNKLDVFLNTFKNQDGSRVVKKGT